MMKLTKYVSHSFFKLRLLLNSRFLNDALHSEFKFLVIEGFYILGAAATDAAEST